MDLLGLIVLIVVLGLVWWAVTTYLPLPPMGRNILAIAFVVVIVLALMSFLGVGTSVLHWKPRV